jgi:transcriptional regulator with XRE-family HTH domain
MTIGSLIRREREGRGLSLADLSERTAIAPSNLSRIECGRVEPRLSTLNRIAEALQCEISLVPSNRPVPIAEVRRRAREGRERVIRSGLGFSDPWKRLSRKLEAGEDISSEVDSLVSRHVG